MATRTAKKLAKTKTAKTEVPTPHRPEGSKHKVQRRAAISPKVAAMVADLEGVCATLRDGIPLEERYTVRRVKIDLDPKPYPPADVRHVRDALGMSQVIFARFLGVDASTVRTWEQGVRPPSPMARRFLAEIEASPEHWKGRVAAVVQVKEGCA
jgi:putative transcriptional regulator